MTTETKGKNGQRKLAEDKYFSLIEHAADGMAIIQDGVFKLVNTALIRISGYDKKELLGMPFTRILTPESQKLTLERYQARLAGKKVPAVYEIQAVTKDGEIRDIEINAALTEYEGRVADEVIIRDITERKKVEDKIRRTEQEKTAILNSMSELVVYQDTEHRIIWTNTTAAESVGMIHEQLVGRHCYEIWPQCDKPCVGCPVAKARQTGKPQEAEIATPDGRVWFIRGYPMRDENGAVIGLLEVALDITERKKAEQALADEATRRRILIDQSRDGIVVLDQNGKVYEANQQFAEMLGYTPEETAQLHVWDWEYLYPRERVLEMIRTVDEAGDRFETQHRRKDGTTYDVEISTNGAMCAGQKLIFCVCRDITERKQAKEALQTEKNKLQSVVGAMTDGLSIQDKDYNIIYQNEIARSYFGDHVGEKCYLVYGDGKKTCEGCPVKKSFRDGKSHTWERPHAVPSGKVIFWENTANPIRDSNGNIVSCLEITRDITERKKAEQALADETTRRSILVDQSLDGIVVLDENSKVYEANQRFAEMLGYTPEEVRELHTWDWDTQWSREELLEMGRKVDETGFHVETYHRRKDGTTIDVEISINGAMCSGQKLIFCVSRDITERKQMEEQLREEREQLDAQNEELRTINEELQATEEELQHSQERLERMFESVTDGISVINLNGVITKVNQRTVEIHGFASEDEMLGRNAFDLVAPRDHERIATDMHQALKERLIMGGEYTLLKADGSEFPGELSTSVLKDGRGKAMGHISTVRDITERKQAEEREKRLEQELNLAGRLASIGQLAAGIAHEINNPLTGVIGFSHLMLSRDIPEDMKQDLQVINSEAQRVAKIVENLLVFAHQRKTGREYVFINDIITKVLELRAYEMKVNNIEVETQLDPNLPLTMADTGQLQQVFLNIVLNAEYSMKKAHHKGNLLVKTEQINGNIRASLTDNGAGISRENLDKIFNPFFTTKEVGKGTGLGLSICHGIITQHNGRIYAQSESGKGAAFVIELPIAAEPAQAGKAKVTKKEPQKPRGAKILVVDDEAAILTFLHRLLTEWGHRVETINNADAALERLKTERYSLILLDIKLPGMNGIELYRHIEEIAPALTRRVMFITGDIMEGATRDFLEKAGVPHITKPIDIEELKKVMNNALNQTQGASKASG